MILTGSKSWTAYLKSCVGALRSIAAFGCERKDRQADAQLICQHKRPHELSRQVRKNGREGKMPRALSITVQSPVGSRHRRSRRSAI
jgi:hypothetical protein